MRSPHTFITQVAFPLSLSFKCYYFPPILVIALYIPNNDTLCTAQEYKNGRILKDYSLEQFFIFVAAKLNTGTQS